MPSKRCKTSRRTHKRRHHKKRAGRRMGGRSINFRPGRAEIASSGFPAERTMRFRYCTTKEVTLVGGVYQYQFRANSPVDPDFSGTGHQPMGWDTWTTLYNHYVVTGSKITVMLCGANSGVSGSVLCNVALTDESAVYSNIESFIEAGRGSTRIINGFTGINPISITSTFSAKKFFNVKDVKDNVERLGADTASQPGDPAFFNITMQGPNNSQLITMTVILEMTVAFSEPKQLPQS